MELIQGEGDFTIDLRTVFADATSYSANGGGSSIDGDGFTLRVPDGSLLSGVTVTATASNASTTSTDDPFDVTVSAAPVVPSGDTILPVINSFSVGPQSGNSLAISIDVHEDASFPVRGAITLVPIGEPDQNAGQIIGGLKSDDTPSSAFIPFELSDSGVVNATVADPPSGVFYAPRAVVVDDAGNRSVIAVAPDIEYTAPAAPAPSGLEATILPVQGSTNTLSFTEDFSAFRQGDIALSFINVAHADEADSATLNGNPATKINDPEATTGLANLSAFAATALESDIGTADIAYVLAGPSNTNVHGCVVVSGGTVGFVLDAWSNTGVPLVGTIPSAEITSANNILIAVMSGSTLADDASEAAWSVLPTDNLDENLTSPARDMSIAIFENIPTGQDFVVTVDGDQSGHQAATFILMIGA